MLRKILLASVAVATIGFFSNSASAQTAANDDGTATANVVTAMTLTAGDDLAFGNVVVTGACTVALTAAASTVVTDSANCASGGTQTAASFTATGTNSATYSITLPASINMTGPGTDIPVDNFVHSAGATPALDGTGNATFYVGGQANFNAIQTAGAYSGTFNVEVDY